MAVAEKTATEMTSMLGGLDESEAHSTSKSELRRENEQLRRELRDRQAALEESIANGTALSRALMKAQSKNCAIEREAEAKLKQADAEMEMARSLIEGLEKQCRDYESRIVTMQRQLGRLGAALRQLRGLD